MKFASQVMVSLRDDLKSPRNSTGIPGLLYIFEENISLAKPISYAPGRISQICTANLYHCVPGISLCPVRFCQALFFAQFFRPVKIHGLRKSGKSGEGCRSMLCEPFMNIHTSPSLWKTLVENSVENVENYELSTGISLLWKIHIACGKVCIPPCINFFPLPKPVCYVTATHPGQQPKFRRKSLQIVKFPCQISSPSETSLKFFVKNSQNIFSVSFSTGGEY